MLSSEHRLRKKKDIDAVFKRGKFFREQFLSLKLKKNNLPHSRFAFIVGKKVSKKAVERNKVKRRLREATREQISDIKEGYDIIVMSFPGAHQKSFTEVKKATNRLYKKARVMK